MKNRDSGTAGARIIRPRRNHMRGENHEGLRGARPVRWVVWGFCLAVVLAVGPAAAVIAASVSTDQPDYSPGDTVFITGAGFWAWEMVTVQVVHDDGDPLGGEGHDPWQVQADGDGGFSTYWVVPYDDNVDEVLRVTADGVSSGLHAETTFIDANTNLTIVSAIPDTICPGDTLTVCALLEEACGGGSFAPLPNREVIFFFNTGHCGVNVGQAAEDTAITNASGIACATLTIPTTPGAYTVRVKFQGESKPSPCPNPGNSACNPTHSNPNQRCVQLSNSNACEPVIVDSAACVTPCTIAVNCPPDVTQSCEVSTDTSVTGSATATGTCPPITIAYSDQSAPGGCPEEFTITRTWIATDAFGNADTCQQVITVEDNTPPVITCPGDLTFECDAVGSFGTATATDNCDPNPSIVLASRDSVAGACPAEYTLTLTYVASDACGNADTCQQVITVEDNTNPSISCPGPISVACEADVPAPDVNLVSASDNCGPVTITHEGDGPLTGGPCGGTITRTYRATDACGNFAECTQIITVQDSEPPSITCPGPTSVQCVAHVPAPDVNLVSASDNCGPVTITHEGDGPLAGGPCGGTITRTYRATDACGNFAECTQIITVHDTEPPTITCPGPVSVQCASDIPAPDPNSVTASDNCGSVTVIHVSDVPSGPGLVIRTYRATDDCGNFAECTQDITIDDTTPPTLTCPGPITVECVSDVPAPDTSLVSATDNCGGPLSIEHVGDGALTGGPCGGTIIRTYRVTDMAGNFAECTQVITVHDTEPPSITCPGPTSVQCVADVPAPDVNLVSASDNCGPVTITHEGDGPLTGGPCGGTITRTYRATDACGNFAECVQIITVDDTTPPVITCPVFPTLIYGCVDEVPTCNPALASATDNCDPNVAVRCERSDNGGAGCAADPLLITDRYIATDDCGLEDTCFVVFTVIDDTPPVLTGCPGDVTVQCNAIPPPGSPSATDNCDPGPSISFTETGSLTGCGGNTGTITRRWIATDACGNADTCVQVITVTDTEPPLCNIPNDTSILLLCPAGEICLPVTASDACDASVFCEVVSGPGAIVNGNWCYTPSPPENFTVTIRCTDDCGNSCEGSFSVSVGCQPPPPPDSCLLSLSIGGPQNPTPVASPKHNNPVSAAGFVHALNGETVCVPVQIDYIQPGIAIGGFDLLICYDITALSIIKIQQGAAIASWEYFTYRQGLNGNCTGGCPSGLIRLVAIADLDNGPGNHPPPAAFQPLGPLANLCFQVTADRNFIGQCVPVTFCWYDCGDNVIASKSGDTTFVDLYNFDPSCLSNPKVYPVPGLCFTDGAICIDEPPDDRGDINLNGVANEVADAVLFGNYFIYGPSVWLPEPTRQVQILATDVNDDGIVLTVADLVYLIRIITGDASPFPADPGTPKPTPYAAAASASMRIDGRTVTVSADSPIDLGGAMLRFKHNGAAPGAAVAAEAAEGMTVRSHGEGSEYRILIAPDMSKAGSRIEAGHHDLITFTIEGDGTIELTEAEFADAGGAVVSSSVARLAILPTSHALRQNSPNPFNAQTVIRFDLPSPGAWTLSVYNVTGQIVRTYGGADDAGTVSVVWNGLDEHGAATPSGVYFYRLQAGDFTASKKMVLLK